MARRYAWVRSIFKRKSFIEDTVEEAIREHLMFVEAHPVPYAKDQRRAAVLQRCERLAKKQGAAVMPAFEPLVDLALKKLDERGS